MTRVSSLVVLACAAVACGHPAASHRVEAPPPQQQQPKPTPAPTTPPDAQAEPALTVLPTTPIMAPSCAEALHDPQLLDPVIDLQTPETDWVFQTRARVLREQCRNGPWTDDAKRCFMKAANETDTAQCEGQLDASVHATLVKINDLGVAIAKLKTTPKKLDCKTLAKAQHVAAKTCASWNTETRACVAAGGAELCQP